MLRYTGLFLFLFVCQSISAQRLVTPDEAVRMALNNQQNIKAAQLTVQQQQQLLRGVAGIQNPQVFGETTPYEPLLVGVQQTFSLPGVYRSRSALQAERIRLAQLQLGGTQYDLKRDVRLRYLQLQYLAERQRLLQYQDSIYAEIKESSVRFFAAGQINKLEELQATTQAAGVRNNLIRIGADIAGEKELLVFYTQLNDSFTVAPLEQILFVPVTDTTVTNIQQQIVQQQVTVRQKELQAERKELLPQVQAGISLPATRQYERLLGYQFGVTIPIWQKQNRSRIAAAQTGIEIAGAQLQLEQQRLYAQYRQALAGYEREQQSLQYYNTVALPQAKAIMETAQRLFKGGELNYIESLRNLQTAFDIFFNHLDTHRAYNEAVIQLQYLNGTL